MPHVLIVDDEEDLCELITLRLENHGFRVTASQTLHQAVDVLSRDHVDCILLDLRLDNENGIELLAKADAIGVNVATIVLTADGASQVLERAKEQGVHAVLTKPFDTHELVRAVTNAARKRAS